MREFSRLYLKDGNLGRDESRREASRARELNYLNGTEAKDVCLAVRRPLLAIKLIDIFIYQGFESL